MSISAADGFRTGVDLGHPVARVFALLADPVKRPVWQASLRAVRLLTPGPPGIGTRWYDLTWPGPRPLLEITQWETDTLWVEHGTWRGVEVRLELGFTDLTCAGEPLTRVSATTVVDAPGWRSPIGWGMRAFGPLVARDDLRRAGRVLGRRPRAGPASAGSA